MITYHKEVTTEAPNRLALVPPSILSNEIIEVLMKHNPEHIGLVGIKQHDATTFIYVQTFNEFDNAITYDRIDVQHELDHR